MTIDPKEIEKRKLIDMEATEMEKAIEFLEAVHMADDVAVIHMKHTIANLYYSLLKEIFPHTVAMYEDEIITTVGHKGMHYLYLTGIIDYCGCPNGHRLFII